MSVLTPLSLQEFTEILIEYEMRIDARNVESFWLSIQDKLHCLEIREDGLYILEKCVEFAFKGQNLVLPIYTSEEPEDFVTRWLPSRNCYEFSLTHLGVRNEMQGLIGGLILLKEIHQFNISS